jgi:hypothetical protein
MFDELYQIDIGHAVAGIVVSCGVVTESAPIFSWMKNKTLDSIKIWVQKKHGTIVPVV